ncbi:RTA1 like protein-domain-containing protein [Tricladium varicosporioides]|nr:RTA1 like protein-domain-containing protein [Hymenoscyphus varicosporioides]
MAPPLRIAIDYCTVISPTCPLSSTIYGYRPSLAVNALLLAIFALLTFAQLLLGIRYKTYLLAYILILGFISESLGYAGRIILFNNPYSSLGFRLQITCLIYAPSFLAAAVYISLARIVRTFGSETSYLKPKLYTWIFVTCDVIALILQAAGGGIAGGAGKDQALRKQGTDTMIAGIVWQVFTLLVFGFLVVVYIMRTKKVWNSGSVGEREKETWRRRGVRCFVAGVSIAFVTIFARCLYRIAEMVGGWANPIMRDEKSFVVMEGFMMVIAGLALTIFHPGYCFPETRQKEESESAEEVTDGSGALGKA